MEQIASKKTDDEASHLSPTSSTKPMDQYLQVKRRKKLSLLSSRGKSSSSISIKMNSLLVGPTTPNTLFLLMIVAAKALTVSSILHSSNQPPAEDNPQVVATDESAVRSVESRSEAANLETPLDATQLLVNRNRLGTKLHIVHLIAPEATQNGTQNVTIDCMFKFDRKLDQRLTIKWFFNDELEPIYQWIPELNKRVYSDRYERFLDKSYEVSEDADFMLQAYKWLQAAEESSSPSSSSTSTLHHQRSSTAAASPSEMMSADSEEQLNSSRRLLANRLNRLAKLGGRHSNQLLESLRVALAMDQPDFSRFRALRLIRPTTELSGRFTCSVSSLDGDDLRSTNLLVYEPAKNFTFGVSRLSNQLYNLTCRANQLFPRPSLALFRYRAGPLDSQPPPAAHQQQVNQRTRPAATTLRQEPLTGTHTQLTVSTPGAQHRTAQPDFVRVSGELPDFNDITPLGDNHLTPPEGSNFAPEVVDATSGGSLLPPVYEISAWALVDEASLSSNVVTQFECLLAIEGTAYEQRQSLALQRGWHVNSASVAMRSTLVGLFSALASLLCLMLALVSAMLIFRLLRRHANKRRVHQAKQNGDNRQLATTASDSEHTNSTGTLNGTTSSAAATAIAVSNNNLKSPIERPTATLTNRLVQQQQSSPNSMCVDQQVSRTSITSDSDGIYRVPNEQQQQATGSFGTRFVIGPGARHQFYGNLSAQQASSFTARAQRSPPQQQQHTASIAANSFSSGKPLYC